MTKAGPKAEECPECGSANFAVIRYGMPAGPPEPGEALGGCVIIVNESPAFACLDCEAEWGLAEQAVAAGLTIGTNMPPRSRG